MDLKEQIARDSAELCRQFGIRRLGLFGSVARGEMTAESDIDFFCEFEAPSPETMPDRYFGFIDEATKRYARQVQILTPNMIRNPFLKCSIERDMLLLHERDVA